MQPMGVRGSDAVPAPPPSFCRFTGVQVSGTIVMPSVRDGGKTMLEAQTPPTIADPVKHPQTNRP